MLGILYFFTRGFVKIEVVFYTVEFEFVEIWETKMQEKTSFLLEDHTVLNEGQTRGNVRQIF